MLVLKLAQDIVALLQALLLEVCLGLLGDLVADEPDHVDMIGELCIQRLDLMLAPGLVEVQAHTPELDQDVVERLILGDDALVVEGVHIGRLNLLRERLDQCLLVNALDPDVDVLIRRRVGEVLDTTLR